MKKLILGFIFLAHAAFAEESFKCVVQYGPKNLPDNQLTQVVLQSQNEVIAFRVDKEIELVFRVTDVPNFASPYYHYSSEIKDALLPDREIKFYMIENMWMGYQPRENTYNFQCQRL